MTNEAATTNVTVTEKSAWSSFWNGKAVSLKELFLVFALTHVSYHHGDPSVELQTTIYLVSAIFVGGYLLHAAFGIVRGWFTKKKV